MAVSGYLTWITRENATYVIMMKILQFVFDWMFLKALQDFPKSYMSTFCVWERILVYSDLPMDCFLL